jgi:hypothetical protein
MTGANPLDMVAAVGPSLGPCCAEYRDYKNLFPVEWNKYNTGNSRFDFWAITSDQLRDAGLPPERVEFARICTKCNSADFFSYRSETVTGRFASVIALREQSVGCGLHKEETKGDPFSASSYQRGHQPDYRRAFPHPV